MAQLRIDQKKVMALDSLIGMCTLHALRLTIALRHIAPLIPLKSNDISTLTEEQLGFMELLISRFGKLQDMIGSKLFPLLLEILQHTAKQQSFLDILHQLEKFGLLSNAKDWLEMRELRNHLTHDYPDNPSLMANNLNKAVEASQSLLEYWGFLRKKAQTIKEEWLTELNGMPFGHVRLEPNEINTICEAFRQFFGPEDHLWVFGSRANREARGGDIDLYIETTAPADAAVNHKMSFVTQLYEKIGEQKIDVVLRLLSSDFHSPIYDIAKQSGVQLV